MLMKEPNFDHEQVLFIGFFFAYEIITHTTKKNLDSNWYDIKSVFIEYSNHYTPNSRIGEF